MDAAWSKNFECWGPTNTHIERQSIFCELCGCNKPLENHELWCPNEPDRIAKDDPNFWYGLGTGPGQFWYDEEADVCDNCDHDCDDDYEDELADWLDDGEDWRLRDRCLGIEEIDAPTGYFPGFPTAGVFTGIGGAPTRATTLPESATERKQYPVATGCLDYFPDAIAAIANLSYVGNEQHNPGKPLHWDRSKSGDEADTAMRHFLARGTRDKDGVRHTTKFAWRALALLQKEIEGEQS